MDDLAIETERLTKIFPSSESGSRANRAPSGSPSVKDVSLQIQKGELFGLLGPNGAGKTTLTKILCTLISPSSGRATVAGYPLDAGRAIRAAVGLVVTDERSFYWRLTGSQNLRFFAALHGLFGRAAEERISALLSAVELEKAASQRFSYYSSGMKQRLAVARSLLHSPSILFLDEPTRSLDPVGTRQLHQLILRLQNTTGMTIFLITHDLSEAEKLCARVAVMHRGEIRTVGPPADLRRRLQRQIEYVIRVAAIKSPVQDQLTVIAPDLLIRSMPEESGIQLSFSAPETGEILHQFLTILQESGEQILSVEGKPPSLERVFDHYTND